MKRYWFLSCLLSVFCLFSISAFGGTWTSGSTTITTSGATLTVSGNGAMADYGYSDDTPWISSSITSIIIEEGVTHIGAYSLSSAAGVARVEIPTSVVSMGEKAFYGSSNISKIYYAGSPNEWASITFTDAQANPFYGTGATHYFYFYGSTTETRVLTFTPGLTEIKDYTFQNASRITDINIPGSVTHIGTYALRCGVTTTVCVNRATPPTTGSNALTFSGYSAIVYVPTGSKSAYNKAPWSGANSINEQAVSGNTLGEFGANVKWSFGEDGVLTLDATGASAAKNITIDAASTTKMPWYYFRRLVHAIKVKGDVTGLNNTLHYHYGISEIILDQNTIPSVSAKYIATNGSSPYTSLFNPCHPLTLRIKLSTLLNSTERAKLETAPWNDGHWQVAIDDEVIIDENQDNIALLETIKDYTSAPFNMRLERTLTNAYFNTFCSPVSLSADEVEATFGTGTLIHAFTGTSYDEAANELTLNFDNAQDYIEAGVPYLFKPANTVSNPLFTDVDPADVVDTEGSVNATHASFYGTLAPVDVTSAQVDAQSFIFLQANNSLTWANGGTLKGMRAYWLLSPGVPSHVLARRPVMRIGNTATGIDQVIREQVPSTKVIRNGQLLIIRDGKTYNAQGNLVK